MEKERLMNLFISELKEIYDAENQNVAAFPKVIAAVESSDLKKAYEKHLKETKGQIDRLNKIFSMLNLAPSGEHCDAIAGLIEECEKSIKDYKTSAVRDAAIISKTQCIEHYEISVYGTLRTFAKELDLNKAVKLLQETLDEEANADKALTKIAEGDLVTSGINREAL